MNDQSFVFYESVYKQVELLEKRLGKETAYDFLKAVLDFGLYGALPDEDAEILLYGFEQTITSIAAAKQRRATAIDNGKKGGRKKTIDYSKVLELKAAGTTNQAIADQMGCSVSSVEKIVAADRKNQTNQKNISNNLNENVNVNENENEKGFEAESLKDCEPGAHEVTTDADMFNF